MHRALSTAIGRIGKDELLILGILSVIGFLAIGLIIEMLFVAFTDDEPKKDYLSEYDSTLRKASCVKILDEYTEILAKPKVGKGSADKNSKNSYGVTLEKNFTVEVTGVYVMDNDVDIYSKFCGLEVSEILATPEGKLWFPKEIKNDPDGIVWISERCIRIS